MGWISQFPTLFPGAASIELTAEDLSEIDTAASELSVTGERLPEPVLRMTGR
jgi:hypothetical protein